MGSNLHAAPMLQDYLGNQYSYDEMLGTDGNLRPHWEACFNHSSNWRTKRCRTGTRDFPPVEGKWRYLYIIGDGSIVNRDWHVDSIPFLISKEEWDKVEASLVQRAELFNLILQDIYGEQKLIKNNIVPWNSSTTMSVI
jgi:uncharacterized circularly permuted ATP-grasp superfamily protein